MKSKFTLVLTKADVQIDREQPLSEVIGMVDVVWSGVCTPEEAQTRFMDLIKKQTHEYRELKTVTKWRVIRLYDADGHQLMQES